MPASPILRFLPLGLSALSFVFAATILGTAAHTLAIYHEQRSVNPWWIPLWSEHFDIAATRSLIGAAATILILNLMFCIANVIPRVGRPLSHYLKPSHLSRRCVLILTLSSSSPRARTRAPFSVSRLRFRPPCSPFPPPSMRSFLMPPPPSATPSRRGRAVIDQAVGCCPKGCSRGTRCLRRRETQCSGSCALRA